jgi:hypothetical protein
MRMFRSVMVVMGLTLASFASAQVSPVGFPVVSVEQASAVPHRELARLESAPGENEVAFAKRVALTLLAFSQETGFEACAFIGQKVEMTSAEDGVARYSVVITTNDSNIACIEQPSAIVVGYTNSRKTIHSHGYTGNFRVNAADVALTGGRLRLNRSSGGRDQNAFSPPDMLEAGYLAARIGLLYQNGHGQVTNFGRYDEPYTYAAR